MDKKVFRWHGKKYYLLGEDNFGERYYLEEAHWDCGWYWGLGYVETFTNRTNPQLSRDILSHQHFDGLLFNKNKNGYDAFKEFFVKTPLVDKEIWQLLELMKSAYNCRQYSDMLNKGGAHYTTNPVSDIIKNEVEYKRINEEVIPAIMEKVYAILGEEK